MKWFKRLLLLSAFVLLVGLNVATVVSSVVFSTLSGLVERVTNIDTPRRQMQQRALRQKAIAQQVKRKGLRRAKRLVAYQALEATSSYLPAIGTAVVVAGTAWELKQLCDSLNDMNDLQAVFELEPEEDEAGKHALAARLGVPHSFVGKVEQCERRLDMPEYVAYCRALEVGAVEGLGVLDAKVRAQLKKQSA